MTTLELIKNKYIIKLKRVSCNWVINNSYSLKTLIKNKRLITKCKTVDEIEELSKNIYDNYTPSSIQGDYKTLFFYLKVNKYI